MPGCIYFRSEEVVVLEPAVDRGPADTDGRRRSNGAQGRRASWRARRRPSPGAGEVGDRAVLLTDSRPAPIEIPIPPFLGFPQRWDTVLFFLQGFS